MKFSFTALLGLFPLVLAAKSLKSVVVTFPQGTPSRVVDQTKDSLVAAVSCASHISRLLWLNNTLQGGVITHEYRKSRVLFTEYLRRKTLKANIHVLLQISSSTIHPDLVSFPCRSSNNFSSGFAAEAPVKALQTLSTQDAAYKPNIEEDKIVSANGDFVGQKYSF